MLSIIDSCFYSGDAQGLSAYMRTRIREIAQKQDFSVDEVSTLVDAALSTEDTLCLAQLISLADQLSIPLPLYDLFRIHQCQGNVAAYRLLSGAFDQYEPVLNCISKASSHPVRITAYELGGLGDYIEAICLLYPLINCYLPFLEVEIRIPTDLADFLSNTFKGSSLLFTRCTWEQRCVPGSVHLLTLSAIARNTFNLSPQSINLLSKTEPTSLDNIFNNSTLAKWDSSSPVLIWNSQSQPKLRPHSLRRSYFHRSVGYRDWLSHVQLYTERYFVIDISEYPVHWPPIPRSERYLHLPAKQIKFDSFAALCYRANSIVTVDSMLVHLCAMLGVYVDLFLAIGHEQRWFIDYGLQDSMYRKNCRVFKQQRLHHWDSMIELTNLQPFKFGMT